MATTRLVPPELAGTDRVLPLALHGLRRDEAVLLCKELPNLGRLLRGQGPGAGDTAAQRHLVRRALAVVQGHPKLVALADGMAADPARPGTALSAAEARLGGADLEAFLRGGEASVEPDRVVAEIGEWTRAVAAGLGEPQRLLFRRLCCLEEEDRERGLVEVVRPGAGAEALVTAGLVEPAGDGWRIHPAVAEAGRDEENQRQVDGAMGGRWIAAQKSAMGDGEDSAKVVEAGLRAAPYLVRGGDEKGASYVLQAVVVRVPCPSDLDRAIGLLRRSSGPDSERLLGVALGDRGQLEEAERHLRVAMETFEAHDDAACASVTAGGLVNVLRARGRYAEALAILDRQAAWTKAAGRGRWFEVPDEVQRLEVLVATGEYDAVLDRATVLAAEIAGLDPADAHGVDPFDTRESTLGLAREVAECLERWDEALRLNRRCLDSMSSRNATPYSLARVEFNHFGSLRELGRLDDAAALLSRCRDAFQVEGDFARLSKFLGAQASLAEKKHDTVLARTNYDRAFRYAYLASDAESAAINHCNCSTLLSPDDALAHRLAAAALFHRMGSGHLAQALTALRSSHLPSWSSSLDEVARRTEALDGVDLRTLLDSVPGPSPQATLDQVHRLLVRPPAAERPPG